jgi:lipopolysaccharide transport system ATP-binding protein
VRARGLGKRYTIGARSADSLRDEVAGLFSLGRWRRARSEGFWALRGVNLEIEQGQTIGVIGRNGAGKSTLLKLLSRITPPTEGHVQYRGRLASLLEVGAGFHRELTGRENIFLSGALLGMRRREIRDLMDAIVAFAEVGRFIDTPVKHYSSGMYVRLAFSVAAHLRADILLVDEVLAVGDAAFQTKCESKMRDVATGEGRTIVLVSHRMGAIRQLCERTVYLQEGQVEYFGPTGEAVRRYLGGATQAGGLHVDFPLPSQQRPHLRYARFVGDRPRPVFEHREKIEIEVAFALDRDHHDVDLNLGVCTPFGRLFMFHLSDLVDRGWGKVKPFLAGLNVVSVCIPGSLLLRGTYSVEVAIYRPGEVYDVQEGALSFEIVDTTSPLVRERMSPGWVLVPAVDATYRRECC